MAIGTSVYFYKQYRTTQRLLKGATNPQNELASLIASVSKLMVLPNNEAPQIANQIGGQVANFPSGEIKPQTDVLIITGK